MTQELRRDRRDRSPASGELGEILRAPAGISGGDPHTRVEDRDDRRRRERAHLVEHGARAFERCGVALTLPHVAGSTVEAFDRTAQIVCDNIARLRLGEPLLHRVA